MPEGPQVYRMAEKLREAIGGLVLDSVTDQENGTSIIGSAVTKIITHGKRAVVVLDSGQGLLITFALTGKLEYFKQVEMPPVTPTTVGIMSFDGLHVMLTDPQHLASLTLDDATVIRTTMFAVGFDPLHTIFGMREWLTLCREHPGQLVAMFITNQSIVAGVGNRYRSEIMHVAKIAPDARIKDLCTEQLELLLISIYRVLKMASRGEYTFAVYGRTESFPDGLPVTRAEIAKGILLYTTAKSVSSARRAKVAKTEASDSG